MDGQQFTSAGPSAEPGLQLQYERGVVCHHCGAVARDPDATWCDKCHVALREEPPTVTWFDQWMLEPVGVGHRLILSLAAAATLWASGPFVGSDVAVIAGVLAWVWLLGSWALRFSTRGYVAARLALPRSAFKHPTERWGRAAAWFAVVAVLWTVQVPCYAVFWLTRPWLQERANAALALPMPPAASPPPGLIQYVEVPLPAGRVGPWQIEAIHRTDAGDLWLMVDGKDYLHYSRSGDQHARLRLSRYWSMDVKRFGGD